MKYIQASLLVLALFACGQAVALPADHPANPEAAAPAFRPADYFAGATTLAADEHEHQHEAAPAAKDEAALPEHKEDKGMDMDCMKMHGDADMHDCPMMREMMRQEGDKPAAAPSPQKDEGHESHH